MSSPLPTITAQLRTLCHELLVALARMEPTVSASPQSGHVIHRHRRPHAALPSPLIPAAYDGGLGYDDIFYGDPEKGVLFQIPPWDGYEDGDVAMIIQRTPDEDIEVGFLPVGADDRHKVVSLPIARRHFASLAFGSYDFFARVRNGGLGGDIDSEPTAVIVKLTLPGGFDTYPGNGDINDNLPPPMVEPLLIDASTPQATVTLPVDSRWNAPYEHMTAGDVVRLRWGIAGNELTNRIQETDIGKPVVFTVSRDMITRGGYGTGININFDIRDVVRNWSMWSPSARGVEIIDPSAPDAPWIEPTVGDRGLEIRLEDLATTPPRALVSGLAPGDRIIMRLRGALADGSPVPPWDSAIIDITEPPSRNVIVPLPEEFLTPLARGQCEAYYTLIRAGVTKDSAHRRLSVSGEPVVLLPPSVSEAVDGIIDYSVLLGDAHAVVQRQPIIVPGTTLRLEMHGTALDGTEVVHRETRNIETDTLFPLILPVPNTKVGMLIGSRATFFYTVETSEAVAARWRRDRLVPQAAYRSPDADYDIEGEAQARDSDDFDDLTSGDYPDPLRRPLFLIRGLNGKVHIGGGTGMPGFFSGRWLGPLPDDESIYRIHAIVFNEPEIRAYRTVIMSLIIGTRAQDHFVRISTWNGSERMIRAPVGEPHFITFVANPGDFITQIDLHDCAVDRISLLR